ncbi:MAG: hypothetical protein CM1200mP2_37100 [Planctomycetaceae bacterium]|nr:MAG: hypothetical protein CM1200mP2_37100 [Planctomycetaceae bacterium]
MLRSLCSNRLLMPSFRVCNHMTLDRDAREKKEADSESRLPGSSTE